GCLRGRRGESHLQGEARGDFDVRAGGLRLGGDDRRGRSVVEAEHRGVRRRPRLRAARPRALQYSRFGTCRGAARAQPGETRRAVRASTKSRLANRSACQLAIPSLAITNSAEPTSMVAAAISAAPGPTGPLPPATARTARAMIGPASAARGKSLY